MIFMILAALEQSERDLLVGLSVKMDLVHQLLTNHLEHHFWYSITMLTGFIGTMTAVSLFVLERRKKRTRRS